MAFDPLAWARNWWGGAQTEPGTAPAPSMAAGLLASLRERNAAFPGRELLNGHAEKELKTERIAVGPKNVIIPAFLPFYDNLTQETPAMRLAYGKMAEENSYVKASLDKRVNGVAALDLTVRPAQVSKNLKDEAKACAKFFEWQLTRAHVGGLAQFVETLLRPALVFGLSISDQQIQSASEGEQWGRWFCRELKPKQYMRDCVLQLDDYYNVVGLLGLMFNGGTEFGPSGFLIHTNRKANVLGLPTGSSELRSCYFSAWAWHTVQVVRLIFLQIQAQPIAVAQIPKAEAGQTQIILQTLIDMFKRKSIVVPEGVLVSALNIAGSAAATYDQALQGYERDITTAINGSSMSTLQGSTDRQRGDSQVHQEEADLPVWRDACAINWLINDPVNGFVKGIGGLNYPRELHPTIEFAGVDLEKMQNELKIDTGIKALGYEQDETKLSERYNRDLHKASVPVGGALSPGMGPQVGPDGKPVPPEPGKGDTDAIKAPKIDKMAEHDVSDEKRDEGGKWTAGGGSATKEESDFHLWANTGYHSKGEIRREGKRRGLHGGIANRIVEARQKRDRDYEAEQEIKDKEHDEKVPQVFDHVDAELKKIGAKLDNESESGSRYYTLPSGDKVRVADHPANAATSNWMENNSVAEIRVDKRKRWEQNLKDVVAPET